MGRKINKEEPIILLGAGLAGSLMALYLAKKGFLVDVYERRPDLRAADISSGRSINLAISARGLNAMKEVGLDNEVAEMCIPMRGRIIHDRNGNTEFQPYSKDGTTAINSISRGDLNCLLMDEADKFNTIKFNFQKRCIAVDMKTGLALIRDETNHQTFEVTGQTVIASDGAFSLARNSMMKMPRFNFSQSYLSHSYKELSFPPTINGGWQIEKNALHIWPRGHFMLIALPNLDGSFTVTLFYPHKGHNSFASLDNPEKVRKLFIEEFPDALELIPDLDKEYFENPVGDLLTIKCDPWHYEDRCVLVGDSAHAIVPFYGQGMNAAFEDCSVLNACIDQESDWTSTFERYGSLRVKNGHAIADMAIDNYYEMRDRVDDEDWKLRKKIEHKLEREYPGKYISRYELISFTHRPYAEALERGIINDRILRKLAEGIDSIDNVDLTLAEDLMSRLLPF